MEASHSARDAVMMWPPRMFRVIVLAIVGVVGLGTGGCGRTAPTPRERLLAELGGDAVTVVVGDARAIAHSRLRGVLEVLGAQWPATMSCVVAAAFAGQQAALTIDGAGNLTVVIASAARPECPALSQRDAGLWIATIGAGPRAASGRLLDEPRFARARGYLLGEPIAGASIVTSGAGAWHAGVHSIVAAAQPDPLEAWIALDVADPSAGDALATAVSALIGRMQGEPSTAPLAAKLRVSRAAPGQVVVQLTGPIDGELAAATRTLLAWSDARVRPAAARFTCPVLSDPNITCRDDTRFRVSSLARALAPLVADGRPMPLVSNGLIGGLRLDAAVATLGLVPGDVIVALAGRPVTSRAMLTELIERARGATTLTIRRANRDTQLELAER